jgi:hypothetical protein
MSDGHCQELDSVAKFIVPDRSASLYCQSVRYDNPIAVVDFIPQSGTKNLVSVAKYKVPDWGSRGSGSVRNVTDPKQCINPMQCASVSEWMASL